MDKMKQKADREAKKIAEDYVNAVCAYGILSIAPRMKKAGIGGDKP
jgi:hypothetical protein